MNKTTQHAVLALAATLLLTPLVAISAAEAPPAARRPNIVYIMADDLGYNDLSCQGATKVTTPGIDRLAKEGMRFTDAHTPAALCSPSRYGALTGRYPWRREGKFTWASPGAAMLIEPGRMTTASLLKQAGYTTGIVGKWHLGFGTVEEPVDWSAELKPGPLEVGFDYFFGDVANRWGCYVENHRILGLREGDTIRFKEGVKKPVSGKSAFTMVNVDNATVLHEKAVAFIEKNKDRPFYLHYVPNNVHTPLTPNKRFQGTSQCGAYGDFVNKLQCRRWVTCLPRLTGWDWRRTRWSIFTSDNGGVYEKTATRGWTSLLCAFERSKGRCLRWWQPCAFPGPLHLEIFPPARRRINCCASLTCLPVIAADTGSKA